jgi:hypothetical protein
MKMNKEDMAKMGEEDMAEGKPMLKVVIKSKPMEEGKEMEKEESEGEESEGEEYGDKEESDWKAQCDANDLLRAAEIKADPMRMKAALEILGQKKKAIDSMEELMAVRKDKMMEKK